MLFHEGLLILIIIFVFTGRFIFGMRNKKMVPLLLLVKIFDMEASLHGQSDWKSWMKK